MINYEHFLKLQHNYNLWCAVLENTVRRYVEEKNLEYSYHIDIMEFTKDEVRCYNRFDDQRISPVLVLTTKELGFSSC